jgi:hypothetical protein
MTRATAEAIRAWVKMVALIAAVGVVVWLIAGLSVLESFELDPAPHWVVAGRGTVIQIIRFQSDYYKNNGSYAAPEELKRLLVLPANGCGDAYCYSYDRLPGGYVIRAEPKPWRRVVCWVTRTKWPTFYADQTGVVRQSTASEPASAASPPVPPDGGW